MRLRPDDKVMLQTTGPFGKLRIVRYPNKTSFLYFAQEWLGTYWGIGDGFNSFKKANAFLYDTLIPIIKRRSTPGS